MTQQGGALGFALVQRDGRWPICPKSMGGGPSAGGYEVKALVVIAERAVERLHLRVVWLCGVVLLLEGYDIAAVGYAIPSLVDAWRVAPAGFTQVVAAGNIGLLLGSVCVGLLGDRLGRKPVLVSCVVAFGFSSLLTASVGSPTDMASLRFLTGLGLGGGIPLAIALASDFAPR
jgi:MFS transporter, AAHS family, 4-hydroxybenzoate transporter